MSSFVCTTENLEGTHRVQTSTWCGVSSFLKNGLFLVSPTYIEKFHKDLFITCAYVVVQVEHSHFFSFLVIVYQISVSV